MVEESFIPSGGCHTLGVCQKPVTELGENACGYLIRANSQVIELRSCNGQKDEDKIVDEEGSEDNKSSQLELFVSLKKIVEGDCGDEGEVRHISQAQADNQTDFVPIGQTHSPDWATCDSTRRCQDTTIPRKPSER